MLDMDSLNDLADLYLLRCEVEGKSPRTIRAYRERLGRFVRNGSVERADEVTADELYRYLGRFTHLSRETRHRYFREVRCFFNWLVDAGHLERSPFRGMRNVRLPQRIVQPNSSEEVARLLDACDDSPLGLRDRALLLVLLDPGARCSEVVKLDMSDLNVEARRLRIRFGKGNKQRVVPVAGRCQGALLSYLAVRGQQPGPLFVAATGHRQLTEDTPLQANGLKQVLRRLGRRAGVAKVHAHRFRHTYAT